MFEKLKLKLMKKLLLILGLIPFLNSAQIVNPCISSDTVLCGPHANDYTYNRTRGFWFQAKSTFNIVGLKAGDGNSQGVTATHQSIEIIKFDNGAPLAFGFTNPHSTLFSTINTPWGWANCNVQIDSGSYYGIIGAKNDSTPFNMYNSYLSGVNKLFINGDSTEIQRAAVQYALCIGSPANGQYFDDGLHSAGRIHFIRSVDNNPQAVIGLIGNTITAMVFSTTNPTPYTYLWNTGETTAAITPQLNGNYWVIITDANGCTSDTAFYNVSFIPSTIIDADLNTTKKLSIIQSLLGTPIKSESNSPLIYIYDDGTVQKRIIIE